MAKCMLLKHYRGAPGPVNDVPMDQWAPDEAEAHVQFMRDFAARLERTGEFVDTPLPPAGPAPGSDPPATRPRADPAPPAQRADPASQAQHDFWT